MTELRIKTWLLHATILLTLLLTSCGSDGTFRINGEIEGYGTGNLRIVYMHRGTLQNVTATAIDGKFSMSGRTSEPVLARLYTGNGRLIGAFIADDGETIEAHFKLGSPSATKLDGNSDSERLADFLHEHADDVDNARHKPLNAAIANYVRSNPDRYTSGALMTAYFHTPGHEAEALELIGLLSDDVASSTSARGLADMLLPMASPLDSLSLNSFRIFMAADSAITVNPANTSVSLLMLIKAETRTSDSLKASLTRLAPLAKADKLQVIDISADHDTAAWQESLRQLAKADSTATRKNKFLKRGWTPDPYGIAGLEHVPVAALPWFIVADSTGSVLYRGRSLSAATNLVTGSKH